MHNLQHSRHLCQERGFASLTFELVRAVLGFDAGCVQFIERAPQRAQREDAQGDEDRRPEEQAERRGEGRFPQDGTHGVLDADARNLHSGVEHGRLGYKRGWRRRRTCAHDDGIVHLQHDGYAALIEVSMS
jgi:hypothetical protein